MRTAQTCTECRERPKRTKTERGRVRLAGSLCARCHGARHREARRLCKQRLRETRPGYVPRVARGQMRDYRRAACDLFRGFARLERDATSPATPLRRAGLASPDVRRVVARLRFQTNLDTPRSSEKAERWRTLALAASDGTVTRQALLALILASPTCAYCGAALPIPARSIDHVRELALGGAHSTSNLVIACLRCNHLKAGHAGRSLRAWV